MTTDTREAESVGHKLVHAAIKRRVADGSVVAKPWELIDAIDEALRDERERAVKIAVKVINNAREEGETDLRSVRARIESAIHAKEKPNVE